MKRLSQGPTYALQIAKELGMGQPLIAKHLEVMKTAGLVTATEEEESTGSGPPRTWFSLARSFSITMDLAPNLFIERAVPFKIKPSKPKTSQEGVQLQRRVESAMAKKGERERLSSISEVLSDIDSRIEEIEEERAELLSTRNQAMHEASMIANSFQELDKRRVLFHILDEHDREVERISEALSLREVSVKAILDELERDFFG